MCPALRYLRLGGGAVGDGGPLTDDFDGHAVQIRDPEHGAGLLALFRIRIMRPSEYGPRYLKHILKI